MKHILVKEGRKKWKGVLPESWNELDKAQFIAASLWSIGYISTREAIGKITKIDTKNMPIWLLMELRSNLKIFENLEGNVDNFIIKKIGKLLCPEDCLNNMPFFQYMAVDSFFMYYAKKRDAAMLDKMIACCYMERNETMVAGASGKKMMDIMKKLRLVASIPDEVKVAIFLNWILVKNWLSSIYKNLFKMGDPYDGKTGDWLEVFDAFVGENIGDIEAYKAMECRDAFRILDRKIEQSRRK